MATSRDVTTRLENFSSLKNKTKQQCIERWSCYLSAQLVWYGRVGCINHGLVLGVRTSLAITASSSDGPCPAVSCTPALTGTWGGGPRNVAGPRHSCIPVSTRPFRGTMASLPPRLLDPPPPCADC